MSRAPAPPLATLVASAEWFPHRFDPDGARVLFVRFPESKLRAAEFLDERALDASVEGAWVPLDAVLEATAGTPHAVPHAIFHIGHCGSTLVANLLDRLPGAIALREPLVLRALAELYEELPRATARCDRQGWDALAGALVGLLARPHGAARPFVKATSNCNALIEPWLARDPSSRAMALSVALEPWLATMLKSSGARADAAHHAPARLAAFHALVGDEALRLPRMGEPERLAMAWLAEQARASQVAARRPSQLLRVDFDALLARGPAALVPLARHFGLAHDADAMARAWHPDVLGRYAKARAHAYSAADRDADLAESRRRHGDAIAAALRHADALRRRYPVLAGL